MPVQDFYLSPFHFFEKQTDDISPKDLIRVKKKYLNEIELSDTNDVMVAGHRFDLNGLNDYFDRLKAQEYAYHNAIWENKSLLNFLERGDTTNPYWTNHANMPDGILDFVFPYFHARYSHELAQCFNVGSFKKWNTKRIEQLVLELPLIEGQMYEPEYFRKTFLTIRKIANKINSGEITIKHLDISFFSILNILPTGYFRPVCNEVAAAVHQTIYPKNKQAAIAWLECLNNDVITVTHSNSESSSSGFNWWWVWGIIMLIRLIAS